MKELLKKLSFLNGKDLADFFKKFKLKAPKALRVDVLREAMAPKVEEQLANTSGGFGIGGQNNYRLLWFAKLSEHQLEKYLSTFDDAELDNKYHNLLVEKMLAYAAEKKVKKADMEELVAASEDNYRRVGNARLDMEEFNNSLDAVFYDEKNCCDGLSVSEFRGVLFNVGTREELFEIAEKYGIKVPARLNKDELLAYCVRQMKIEKYYTAEAEAALSEMTAKDLREWAKNHNIQSGSQLNKKDLIEYILSDYSKTKEDYEVPKDDSVYEMAIPLPYGQEEVDVEALEAKIAELTAEKEKLEKDAAKNAREINRNKKKIGEQDKEIARLLALIAAKEKEYDELKAAKAKVKEDKATDKEQDAAIAKLEEEIKALQIELAVLKAKEGEESELTEEEVKEAKRNFALDIIWLVFFVLVLAFLMYAIFSML